MTDIDVQMNREADGYVATVNVSDGTSATTHRVSVPSAAIERLAPRTDPATLVRASFEFLLEREPKESILRAFEISVIERYFPAYPAEIGRRLSSEPGQRSS